MNAMTFDPSSDYGDAILYQIRERGIELGMEFPLMVGAISPDGSAVTVKLSIELKEPPVVISGSKSTGPLAIVALDQLNKIMLFSTEAAGAIRLRWHQA
jgi:hypothetical protein